MVMKRAMCKHSLFSFLRGNRNIVDDTGKRTLIARRSYFQVKLPAPSLPDFLQAVKQKTATATGIKRQANLFFISTILNCLFMLTRLSLPTDQ